MCDFYGIRFYFSFKLYDAMTPFKGCVKKEPDAGYVDIFRLDNRNVGGNDLSVGKYLHVWFEGKEDPIKAMVFKEEGEQRYVKFID